MKRFFVPRFDWSTLPARLAGILQGTDISDYDWLIGTMTLKACKASSSEHQKYHQLQDRPIK